MPDDPDDPDDDWLVQRRRRRIIMAAVAAVAGAGAVGAFVVLVMGTQGELLEETDFGPGGELEWEIQVPATGLSKLWLHCQLDSPAEQDLGDDDLEPVFYLEGTLALTTGEQRLYKGPVTFANEGSGVRGGGGSYYSFGTTTCDDRSRRCSVDNTVRLSGIDLPQDHAVIVAASLPLVGERLNVEACSMQLRWHEG